MSNRLVFAFLIGLCACNSSVKSQEKKETSTIKPIALQDTVGKINRTEAEWRAILTPEQYEVLRLKGTDRPFTGALTDNEARGTYYCAACGYALFTSDMKFKSECGWPSFERELAGNRINTEVDRSYGMIRTEIMCARCGSHLGHLFDDGPTITGQRYCVNSTSLLFKRAEEQK